MAEKISMFIVLSIVLFVVALAVRDTFFNPSEDPKRDCTRVVIDSDGEKDVIRIECNFLNQ